MTARQNEQQPIEKQAYEKPILRSISLVADQVLVTGCKVSTGTINNSGYEGCGVEQTCSENGS